MNIVSQIYLLAVKELSELSHGCEWPQLWPLTAMARTSFLPDGLGRPAAVDLGLLGASQLRRPGPQRAGLLLDAAGLRVARELRTLRS